MTLPVMASPRLLDDDRLAAVDTARFCNALPYPWMGLEAVLTPEAFGRLRADLPPVSMMEKSFGRRRAHGQQPHDRYVLEYRHDLPVAASWHEFIAELEAAPYRDWLARLFGTPKLHLSYHWHYTPDGCSVSPHCDARHKLGSHIFYFNTIDDWDPAWGGETLILDDGGRFSRNSAPDFDAFDHRFSAPTLGNQSLLFRRQGNSWHGVKPIHCPPDALRKVFIIVINSNHLAGRLRRLFK